MFRQISKEATLIKLQHGCPRIAAKQVALVKTFVDILDVSIAGKQSYLTLDLRYSIITNSNRKYKILRLDNYGNIDVFVSSYSFKFVLGHMLKHNYLKKFVKCTPTSTK